MTTPLSLDATFEDLQAIKKANLDGTIDMRETSPLFNATVVNTIETTQMLATLKSFKDSMYADTAPREELIKLMIERGLKPKLASPARWRGVFNINVAIGTRFSLGQLNYFVVEQLSAGQFILECETSGEIGNFEDGALIPIDYVNGLQSAMLVELLVPGEDDEETESMRRRYKNSFNSIAYGGNRADYKEKTLAQAGVGGVRVYRAWNGGGTVKLVIINSLFQKPTQVLVDTVQEEADPLHAQGEGLGFAPIDHIVTIFAVDETVINIAFTVSYQNGWIWADIASAVQVMVDDYFAELAKEWVESDNDAAGVVVRASHLEARLLGIAGVLDVTGTTLNGGTANIQLSPESIPKRGTIGG